jgi:hypothetical protein
MKIKSIRIHFSVILAFLFLMTGCNMNNPLILEMETAYKLPSNSATESNKHVAEMISKHFPKGMKVSDALKEIAVNEFAIYEYTLEGIKLWPSGALEPYPSHVNDEKSKNIRKEHYIEKQVDYRAKFDYWPSPLEKREVNITIESNDGVIVKSTGVIYSRTF